MFDVLNDVPGYLVTIFALLVAVLLGSIMIDGLVDKLTLDPSTSVETISASEKFAERFLNGWDLFSVTMIVIIFGGSMWLAYRLPATPLLLWGGLLYLVIVVFSAIIVSNIYEKTIGASISLSDKLSQLTYFPFVMDNLVIISIIYIVSITVVLMIGGSSGVGAE